MLWAANSLFSLTTFARVRSAASACAWSCSGDAGSQFQFAQDDKITANPKQSSKLLLIILLKVLAANTAVNVVLMLV